MHREHFEWIKTAKREDVTGGEIKPGAHKLVRLHTKSEAQAPASSSKNSRGEVVNVWPSLKHAFSLDLGGNGSILGGHWALMSVMNALRLW